MYRDAFLLDTVVKRGYLSSLEAVADSALTALINKNHALAKIMHFQLSALNLCLICHWPLLIKIIYGSPDLVASGESYITCIHN